MAVLSISHLAAKLYCCRHLHTWASDEASEQIGIGPRKKTSRLCETNVERHKRDRYVRVVPRCR